MRFRTAAAVLMLGLVTSAGCSPVSGTPSPTTTTSNKPAAPRVEHPLDTAKFQAAPCTMLTAAQVAPYGITTPGKVNNSSKALGPGCIWQNPDNAQSFEVQFITANTAGLTALYINKDIIVNGGGYWVATTIQGYPGVFNSSLDDRKTGDCSLAVGVTDALTYNVAVATDKTTPQYSDPCGMTTKIADTVLTTLRGGA